MDRELLKKEAESQNIPYSKKGRVLVWHDEFDGEELDRTKWGFARSMSGKDRIYDNGSEQVRVENGNLHMITSRSNDIEKPYILAEGLITNNTMLFKYGYLEMRGKVPFKQGAWPSFWMQSATPFSKAEYFSEIDIFEVFSSKNKLGSTLHKWGKGKHTGLAPDTNKNVGPWTYTFKDFENLNNEYHTYGFEWDENFTKFYVDDECYACFKIDEASDFDKEVLPGMQGFHDFSYVIFNNEIFTEGGGWSVPGWNLTEEDEMPIHYYIDYVRLYQNPEKEEIKLCDEIAAARKLKENSKI